MPCNESKRLFTVWAETIKMRDTYFASNTDPRYAAIRAELTGEARRALDESNQHPTSCLYCRTEATLEQLRAQHFPTYAHASSAIHTA